MRARVFRVTFLAILAATSLFVLGSRCLAADDPAYDGGTLKPIPADAATPGQAGVAQSGAVAAGACEEDCTEFCGLPCCSPPGRFWMRTDYLMWWTNGMQLPPLLTTSPIGTPIDQAGALPPFGNATVVYGNQTVANDLQSGVRIRMGFWLDACHRWGIEGDYFTLGEGASNYDQFSNGNPILARPFYNVQEIHQGRELVSYPGVVEGRYTAHVKDYFQSAGVNLRYNLCCCENCGGSCGGGSCGDPGVDVCGMHCCRTDLIVGYRYYSLNDSVAIQEDLRTLQSPIANWLFQINDNFRASNEFHGTEIGLASQIYRGKWSLEILAKMALGNNHQVVTIDGQTIVTPTDQPTQVRNGGVFANRSNMGTYTRDVFTIIPQLGLELGYQWNCHWRTYLGYNILYWGCVMRSPDQIDLNVDPRNVPVTQDPALPFPAFPGRTSCFWAQGVNLGLEYRF